MATGLLFTLAEARGFDGARLASTAAYPDAAIDAGHDLIRRDFEEILGVALAATSATEVLDGDPDAADWWDCRRPLARELVLPHQEVTAVTAVETRQAGTDSWIALTVDELAGVRAARDGRLIRETGGWPTGAQNVRATYTHGLAAVPAPLKRAALIVLVEQLVNSNVGERSTAFTDGAGQTYRLATAGEGRASWYGLPQVDSVLARFRRRVPGIG